MKKFLVLMSVMAIVFASCEEKIPPQPTGIEDYNYVFKKKDGKILTGVEVFHSNGVRCLIIPIEYDKITTAFNDDFFLVYKGNEVKVRDEVGSFKLDGMSIRPESIEHVKNNYEPAFFKIYRFDNATGQKCWWFSFQYLLTGYDDIIPCCNGFVFKQNNKYGYAYFSPISNGGSLKIPKTHQVIASAKYDALYEVTNNLGINYFLLAREGNKWVVLTSQGQIAKHYPSCINKSLASLPLRDKIELDMNFRTEGGKARAGQEKAGMISVSIYDLHWNPYCR